MRADPRLKWLDRMVRGEMRDLPVVKVKLYATDGVTADRDFVFTCVPVRGAESSRVDAVLEIYADVTESRAQDREANEREMTIRHQAHHHVLTALPNRVRFAHRLQQVLSLASLDHPAGDHLLKVAAARIRKTLRRTDLLFRMGGDEFTVILTERDTT